MSDEKFPTPIQPPYTFWGILNLILQKLKQQDEAIDRNTTAVGKNTMAVGQLKTSVLAQSDVITALAQAAQTNYTNLQESVDKIIAMLTPPKPGPATEFELEVVAQNDVAQGDQMAAKKFGKMKVTFLDNGTAVATISGITDNLGVSTTFEAGSTAVWLVAPPGSTTQDPALALTPLTDANGLPTGCVAGPSATPAAVSGDVWTCIVTQPTTGAMAPQTYSPVNMTGSTATGFVITAQ